MVETDYPCSMSILAERERQYVMYSQCELEMNNRVNLDYKSALFTYIYYFTPSLNSGHFGIFFILYSLVINEVSFMFTASLYSSFSRWTSHVSPGSTLVEDGGAGALD